MEIIAQVPKMFTGFVSRSELLKLIELDLTWFAFAVINCLRIFFFQGCEL